ncbi:hypothetical protein GCM10022199_01560 [Marihabitans asiaticum]
MECLYAADVSEQVRRDALQTWLTYDNNHCTSEDSDQRRTTSARDARCRPSSPWTVEVNQMVTYWPVIG